MDKEVVTCLMTPGKICKGRKRKNLSMLMCDEHLRDCYGLEMGFTKHDMHTEISMVGGFLQPAENIVFAKDTVILPTRHFFDHTIRPQDTHPAESPEYAERNYVLNPQVYEMIRGLMVDLDKKGAGGGSSDKKQEDSAFKLKFMIEMYRNLVEPDVNSGPQESEKYKDRKMITLINTKKTISQTDIETQSIWNHIPDIKMIVLKSDGKTSFETPLSDMKISLGAKFILMNCMYASFVIKDAQTQNVQFVDQIMPNVQWVENVGLVALEHIGQSNFLIIRGIRQASRVFFNSFISTIRKQIVLQKVDHRNTPSQFFMASELRDGATRCLEFSNRGL